MKIPFQSLLAFAFLIFSGGMCAGGESLSLLVTASPTTFTSVGEKITYTYKIVGDEFIDYGKSYIIKNDVADAEPVCSKVSDREMSCTSTHTITEQDLALGYVTSKAEIEVHVYSRNIISFRAVNLQQRATTTIYMENFVPSPTPITTTATPVATSTPSETGQENSSTLQPILAGSVSACDTGMGFINFPISEPIPDLTGKNITVSIDGQRVNCTVAGSRNQVLACSLPASTNFPVTVIVNLDNVEVNNFSYNGATCINTVPTKEKDPNDPNTPVPTPTPVDCELAPYSPNC